MTTPVSENDPFVRIGRTNSAFTPGIGLAFLGVLAFSGTLPATRFAIRGFDPGVVGAGRTVGAAALCGIALVVMRVPLPPRSAWRGLVLVALGAGIGFGFLSSLALRSESAAHAAVVIALMPLATAILGALRGGERPAPAFWLAAIAGTVTVMAYVLIRGGGEISLADGLLLAATLCAAVGYAEGGLLARTMPGWQVIAWGVVLSVPIALPLTIVAVLGAPAPHYSTDAVLGFAYTIVVSMFVAFIFWYNGLAQAGIARASQVQLIQPLLTVVWAGLLLHESIGIGTVVAAILVVVCIGATQRARITTTAPASD